MLKKIACVVILAGMVSGIGVLFVRAVDKTMANQELYGWRAGPDGVAYRNIDVIKSGG